MDGTLRAANGDAEPMPDDATRAAVRSSLILKSLPAPIVDTVLASAVEKRYDRGETLFLQGEPAAAIHIVVEGWVKLYRISPNGTEAVVNVFTRGHSFGEAVALRDLDYPVSAEAVTDCTVTQIPAATLIGIMRDEPGICMSILASTFQHLHELVQQIEQMKAQTGTQRVAEFLIELAPVETGSCVVTLPYDKVLIAGRLGMKPESLSRAFAKLRGVGVRITRNNASIESVERLRVFAEEDPAAAWNHAL